MTAKCGSCYWNVTIPSCAYSYMALYGENCDEWRPAKEYEHGRPRGGRGGSISMTGTTPIDTIIQGDALTRLKELPSESVDCCITSPPYFGSKRFSGEFIDE